MWQEKYHRTVLKCKISSSYRIEQERLCKETSQLQDDLTDQVTVQGLHEWPIESRIVRNPQVVLLQVVGHLFGRHAHRRRPIDAKVHTLPELFPLGPVNKMVLVDFIDLHIRAESQLPLLFNRLIQGTLRRIQVKPHYYQ